MGDHSDVVSWFSHPVYSRYWQHYQQAMVWLQRHRRAYGKAMEAFHGASVPQRYADWHVGEDRGGSLREGARPRAARYPGPQQSSSDSESESEIECDVSNMEITEELRQYFTQTEQHREELRKLQQLEAERQGPYLQADHDLHRVHMYGAGPPLERPGERRGVEMKKLYGEDAAKIQGMETAMQLTFDRKCDKKQPKYWPVIPLRL
ncbi:gem-associated protein 8 isoform X1 [Brienomyrus brachyistius]|uniref:gem-associated protein 8 isoform X1 n=2 Tax=Brienomyrus brachyistius TaxID=42636 RepID=UPI0020B44D22|nr:gem-associated protein 8 isoform X1 [Brienomyrus brachyistius]